MLLSLPQEMLLIAWVVSHICGGPDKVNVLIATACVALQFVTTHPVCQHKLAWNDVAVVGGENFDKMCPGEMRDSVA